MNAARVDVQGAPTNRWGLVGALVLVVVAAGLLLVVATGSARLELVLAALGCISGAAAVTLLTR